MGHSALVFVDPKINNVNGLLYIHIPKNASCWARYHLDQLFAHNYNYYQQGFDKEKNLALVILRDPVERWISAMGQILVGVNKYSPIHIDVIEWNSFTKKMFRNNHTQPQHEFFANIPHDRIVWFRCDHSLDNKFVDFFKNYNLSLTLVSQDQDVDNVFNITKKVPTRTINHYTGPTQQQIVDKIKTIFDQNPKYIDNIKNLYYQDYKLLDSVKFQ